MATARHSAALATFRSATIRSPEHTLCAHAYYWLALDAWRRGAAAELQDCASRILVCLGPKPNFLSGWQLEGKALCLLSGLDAANVSAQAVRHSREKLDGYVRQILADLARLAS